MSRVPCLLCLLQLLMRIAFLAPPTVFLQQNFALHGADVFVRPVVDALAFTALEPNDVWLRHNDELFF